MAALEYAGSPELTVDGVSVRVLPLSRIIASKRAANRIKDQAAPPALEGHRPPEVTSLTCGGLSALGEALLAVPQAAGWRRGWR